MKNFLLLSLLLFSATTVWTASKQEDRAQAEAKRPAVDVFLDGISSTNAQWSVYQKRAAFSVKEPFLDLRFQIDVFSEDGVKERAFVEAVREIQNKLSETQTGVLTYGQWDKVRRAAVDLKERAIWIGTDFRISDYGTWVTAEGTQIIVGEQIADPINWHKITADKAAMTCVDNLVYRHGDGFFAFDTTYRILSWSDEEIVAATDYGCRTEKLILGRKTKEVSFITTDRNLPECKDAPKLPAPRVSKLVNASSEQWKFYERRRKEAEKLISDSFQKKSKALELKN